MKRTMYGLTMCVLLLGMSPAFQIQTVFAYTVDDLLKLTKQIQNENPGIEFKLRTDKAEYKVGEDVVIEFMADKDCYVALIDIGTSGRAIILFPNKWHPDNKVEKGKPYSIPATGSNFSFRVMGPGGEEHIKALASVDPVLSKVESLQEELKQPVETKPEKGQVFLSMKDPGVVLKDVGIVFQKLDPSKWATVDYTFKISEQTVGTTPSLETKPTVAVTKPPQASEVFKGKSGTYEVWYDPAKWKVASSENPVAETGFLHSVGDIAVNVVFERAQGFPRANLKKAFLNNLKKVAANEVIKEDKELKVNGAVVTSMTVDCSINGVGFTFLSYLWVGESEIIQVISGTTQNLFPEFKDDIEKLLNGLVILKP
ncbi:MAG: DUF4384 domain-containing protein [Pseudomonadota bacterium]